MRCAIGRNAELIDNPRNGGCNLLELLLAAAELALGGGQFVVLGAQFLLGRRDLFVCGLPLALRVFSLEDTPEPPHQQEKLVGVIIRVVGRLVGNTGHEDDTPLVDDRHSHVPQDAGMAFGTALLLRVWLCRNHW